MGWWLASSLLFFFFFLGAAASVMKNQRIWLEPSAGFVFTAAPEEVTSATHVITMYKQVTCDVSPGSLSQEERHTNTAAAAADDGDDDDDAFVTDVGRRHRQVVLSIDCGHAEQLEHCLKRFLLCCLRELGRWLMLCNVSTWNKGRRRRRRVLLHHLDSAAENEGMGTFSCHIVYGR